MGFINDIGESLGFKRPNANTVDPNSYSGYYEQAMKDIYNTGNDPASQQMRQGIQGAAQAQLGGLAENSAQRKAQFAEDMNRSFGGQVQELARAKGGTGTLQQALRPSGQLADANARATARGYTDLYSQGIKDLQGVQGIQNSLFGQDLAKTGLSANAQLDQQKLRLGQANTNSDNINNAGNQQAGRLGSTLGGIAKAAGLGGFGSKKED